MYSVPSSRFPLEHAIEKYAPHRTAPKKSGWRADRRRGQRVVLKEKTGPRWSMADDDVRGLADAVAERPSSLGRWGCVRETRALGNKSRPAALCADEDVHLPIAREAAL